MEHPPKWGGAIKDDVTQDNSIFSATQRCNVEAML